MKAIAKSRGDRYASCAELAADLRRFLANEPVLARRTGLLGAAASRLRRFRRRHGGIFAALVLAFGVAGAFLGKAGIAPIVNVGSAEPSRLLTGEPLKMLI